MNVVPNNPIDAAEHLDYARRLILARCPELDGDDFDRISAKPGDVLLPAEIGEHILDVLAAVEERLSALERWINVEGEE
jgi:hypothetical protein